MDITINVHHYFHGEPEGESITDRLANIQALLAGLIDAMVGSLAEEDHMSQQLDDLKAEVERSTAVGQSAITLIQGLAAQIEAQKNDPAALQALADSLKASDQALADAVTANTPAQP